MWHSIKLKLGSLRYTSTVSSGDWNTVNSPPLVWSNVPGAESPLTLFVESRKLPETRVWRLRPLLPVMSVLVICTGADTLAWGIFALGPWKGIMPGRQGIMPSARRQGMMPRASRDGMMPYGIRSTKYSVIQKSGTTQDCPFYWGSTSNRPGESAHWKQETSWNWASQEPQLIITTSSIFWYGINRSSKKKLKQKVLAVGLPKRTEK